jgi:hypothetical protein
MTTGSILIVRQTRDRLHSVLVARTWELGTHIDDIESVELLEHRKVEPGVNSARHVWRAKPRVPQLLAPHVEADHFRWTAIVEWRDDRYDSRWRIEPHAVRQAVTCSAVVKLSEAIGGRATRISIDTSIEGLEGQSGVQEIAHRIVLVNWQKLVEASVRRLESQP